MIPRRAKICDTTGEVMVGVDRRYLEYMTESGEIDRVEITGTLSMAKTEILNRNGFIGSVKTEKLWYRVDTVTLRRIMNNTDPITDTELE